MSFCFSTAFHLNTGQREQADSSGGRAGWGVEGLRKRRKIRERIHGHGQQRGDCRGSGGVGGGGERYRSDKW